MTYFLSANDKPTNNFDDFEAAKRAAHASSNKDQNPRIETYVAPAPSEIWTYDNLENF